MDYNENYKGSFIFSNVISSLKKNNKSNKESVFPSLDFLEKKNKTINLFNNIDFYCLIDIQKEGAIVLEKNLSLHNELKNLDILNIIGRTAPSFLQKNAQMDKVFTEFHIQHKLKPLEMVLNTVNPMVDDKGEELFLRKSICVLSNDENGFPLFGFCAISIVNQVKEDFDSKNFNIDFTKSNEELENELKNTISKAIN